MPPPEIELGKTVIEGILLKLGDLILMNAPSAAKKGVAVTIIMLLRKAKKGKRHAKNNRTEDKHPPRVR